MNNSPIFVFDIDGRVVVYDDVKHAEQSLEAIDVNDNEYPIAYDVEGHAYADILSGKVRRLDELLDVLLQGPRMSPAQAKEKGLRVETDLWGHDVPHDWPSWRAQLAHHLPRFV